MESGADRLTLRQTFDEAAARYDRVRPGYPEALFDDLASLCGLRAGSRVLEVGCGTGQATVPLARRGYRVCAVELGARMAEVARARLAAFPAVEVVTAAFEDWRLPPASFDVVMAATSFHSLDPEVRLAKAARPLRPGGALAVVSTHHVAGGSRSSSMPCRPVTRRGCPGRGGGRGCQRRRRSRRGGTSSARAGTSRRPAARRYERDIA